MVILEKNECNVSKQEKYSHVLIFYFCFILMFILGLKIIEKVLINANIRANSEKKYLK